MCLYFKVIRDSGLKVEFSHVVLLDDVTNRRSTKSQHTGGSSPSKTLTKNILSSTSLFLLSTPFPCIILTFCASRVHPQLGSSISSLISLWLVS